MKFEGKVEDYHMGTLVRLDCNQDISEKNTSLGKDPHFSLFEVTYREKIYIISFRYFNVVIDRY